MILFVRPVSGPIPSGGTRYDEEVLAAWSASGIAHRDVQIAGSWPQPDAAARARVASALAAAGSGPVLLDGLLGSACPDELEEAAARGVRLGLLIHLPLEAEAGLPPDRRATLHEREQRALDAVAAVIVPSAFAAADLARRFRLPAVPVVARPGQAATSVAHGSTPPLFVIVGALTPVKNHCVAVDALAGLADRPWSLAVVGGAAPETSTLGALTRQVADAGLAGRVRFAGVLRGAALDGLWAASDLLLLPSLAESFGMVVSEALARGVPAVVASGTGAVEALAGPGEGPLAGASADPSDPGAWRDTLAAWLDLPALRADWRRRALLRRDELTGWDATARTVADALGRFRRPELG